MKQKIQAIKNYISEHKRDFTTGAIVVAAIAFIIIGLALYSYNDRLRKPTIVYEPARACELLTLDEAKEFLGESTIKVVESELVQTENLVTSKCGYSDGKIDVDNAVVIALNIRSGINDAGIELNRTQFINGMPSVGAEMVNDLGDSAYFNRVLGQLNILKQSTWIILSYGPGADPASNTLEDAVELAQKVIK